MEGLKENVRINKHVKKSPKNISEEEKVANFITLGNQTCKISVKTDFGFYR
jgi:hypothetical protein